jgi:SAM-dependent methyltransferase
MVEICKARAGQGDFRVHDLGDPIGWLADASVDLALCALAIEYVDDRVGALRELRRVLRPGGALVLSRQHPTGDWLRHGGSYFDVRTIAETWSKGWQVRYWLAPLETTCEEIFAAGFLIERLLEPRPGPRGRRRRSRGIRAPQQGAAGIHRVPAAATALRCRRGRGGQAGG